MDFCLICGLWAELMRNVLTVIKFITEDEQKEILATPQNV